MMDCSSKAGKYIRIFNRLQPFQRISKNSDLIFRTVFNNFFCFNHLQKDNNAEQLSRTEVAQNAFKTSLPEPWFV
jgi:hypothetical protein